MNKIYLEEIRQELGYASLRDAKKWCVRNNVELYKPAKLFFASEIDFKLAYDKPFINKLKKKFGKDWETIYNFYNSGNIKALDELFALPECTVKTHKLSKNPIQREFQHIFKDHAKTKAA